MAVNIYSSVDQNRRKVVMLSLLFPIVMAAFVGLFLTIPYVIEYFSAADAELKAYAYNKLHMFVTTDAMHITLFTMLGCFTWVLISYFMGSKMILSSVGAIKVDPQKSPEYLELTRLVENVSITAGIKCPAIYVIEDESCNAFATGYDINNSAVTFTTGILKKLNKQELEGVVAHEISHILNYDIRTMVLMISCIGFCTFVGEVLLRSSSSSSRSSKKGGGGLILLLGIGLLIFGYLIAPLMRLATSRKQEFRADANAALLTRNPLALASALEKISVDSRVESMDSKKLASSICIADPLQEKKSFFSKIAGLTKTHPPIADRVNALKGMGQ